MHNLLTQLGTLHGILYTYTTYQLLLCRVCLVHYHSAASLCASLLCPKCSQFAVKHDECGMSSLTTRLGTRCAAQKGCALPCNREKGGHGMQGAECRVQALKSRWHWQKGWHCVRPHDQMIVSQSHILTASTL